MQKKRKTTLYPSSKRKKEFLKHLYALKQSCLIIINFYKNNPQRWKEEIGNIRNISRCFKLMFEYVKTHGEDALPKDEEKLVSLFALSSHPWPYCLPENTWTRLIQIYQKAHRVSFKKALELIKILSFIACHYEEHFIHNLPFIHPLIDQFITGPIFSQSEINILNSEGLKKTIPVERLLQGFYKDLEIFSIYGIGLKNLAALETITHLLSTELLCIPIKNASSNLDKSLEDYEVPLFDLIGFEKYNAVEMDNALKNNSFRSPNPQKKLLFLSTLKNAVSYTYTSQEKMREVGQNSLDASATEIEMEVRHIQSFSEKEPLFLRNLTKKRRLLRPLNKR